MPSIANEYLRSRQKHDNTAREWTKLYAQPTKTKTATQNKGKGKAVSIEVSAVDGSSIGRTQAQRPRPQRIPSAAHTIVNGGVIDLTSATDSSSASRARAGTKRKRANGSEDDTIGQARRRRSGPVNQSTDVIEIDD